MNKFKKEILWQLASNDGWNKIEGVIYDLKKCADGSELCFANIVIKGKFWQRDLVACDESECAELLQDFEVSLFQIALKNEKKKKKKQKNTKKNKKKQKKRKKKKRK